VGVAPFDAGDEAGAAGLGLVPLEVEAGAFEVATQQVNALGLLARLDAAVVHALVADQGAQEVGRLGGRVVRSRGHETNPRPVRLRARPCRSGDRARGGARPGPRARGARGGRTSRSPPSRPSACAGTARATVAAPWRARARRMRRAVAPCARGDDA